MRPIFLVLLHLFAAPLLAEEAKSTYRSVEVADGVYMISGVDSFVGGNMGLMVDAEHIVMIDDGISPMAPELQSYVRSLTGRPVNLMINTHVHGDHVGGNALFAENGAVIFAHENIRKRMLANLDEAGGSGGLPVVTFADGVTFHLNGIEARVTHESQAHTDGDAWIHYPGVNIIHTGDLLFHSLYPFIDMDNGGSVDGFIAALEKIIAHADDRTRIIPGHGELSDKAGAMADLAMLKDSQARIRRLVEQGKTADEIVAENPLAHYHDQYNWGFISTEIMTRMLVRDLSQ